MWKHVTLCGRYLDNCWVSKDIQIVTCKQCLIRASARKKKVDAEVDGSEDGEVIKC
jgi:hypothetical protein